MTLRITNWLIRAFDVPIARKPNLIRNIMKTCKIEGCAKKAKCRDYCDTHYARFRKHGDPLKTLVIRYPTNTTCLVSGCGRKPVGNGLCGAHWQRVKFTGRLMPEICIGDKSGAHNPNWKGGEIQDGHGRTLVYSPDHPNPNWKGTHVYRYRLVMEKHLGRFLTSEEIVHHINHNPGDDRIENLQVMTQSEHAKLHHTKCAA